MTHGRRGYMSDTTTKYAKMLTALGNQFYEMTIQPRVGDLGNFGPNQIYIQLIEGGNRLFSYPAAVDWPDSKKKFIYGDFIADTIEIDSPVIDARRVRQTVYNFESLDFQYDKLPVITIAHPLVYDRIIYGVLIWELPRNAAFNELLVPESFQIQKYSFAQVIKPDTAISDTVGNVLY